MADHETIPSPRASEPIMARRSPQPPVKPVAKPGPRAEDDPDDADAELAAWLGERLRRVSLGLIAALATARAYWPGEPDFKTEVGGGLSWALAVLLVGGLALASVLVGGTLRLRWSWADAAVVGLMWLVGLSAVQATDRRPAINLAWDWAALGIIYLLLRHLPRTRAEVQAMTAVLAAPAVALAVYGIYQVGIELPMMRARYLSHKAETLQMLGIAPGSPAQGLLENRLLGSNEPMSTFALTNSLAGFLVGPLVVMLGVAWESLVRREGRGSRFGTLALAAPPILVVLACLILTKSRSSYIGLTVGVAVLAFRAWGRVRFRTIALAGLAGLLVVGAMVAAGLATGRLDRLVITQTHKSMRFRGEYWIGAWRAITENSWSFWMGHGVGNFAAPYLRHKLPQSSEEIVDPHNMVLDVWASAGLPAAVLLVAALVLGLRDLLGPATLPPKDPLADEAPPLPSRKPDAPSPRATWLVACGGGGGWLAATLLGHLNPFEGDLFFRWLILGGAWLWAILFLLPLWRRLPIAGACLGAGVLATAVNLLAAGGIGIAPVALMLWSLMALGMDLRDDRRCGLLRDAAGRLATFGLAAVWAALVGSFFGAVLPFWESERALADADAALAARPPDYTRAEEAYDRAIRADKFSARPWLGLANAKYREWQTRGSKPDDLRWRTIPFAMAEAVKPPRNPNAWSLHRDRALVTRQLLSELNTGIGAGQILTLRANIVEATRRASRLYPSNATLHARLAEASAEMHMVHDAVKEAREALRLDALTPHLDKKLDPALKKSLQEHLPEWEKAAEGTEPLPTSPPSRAPAKKPGAK
jgi:O-antigen ligase